MFYIEVVRLEGGLARQQTSSPPGSRAAPQLHTRCSFERIQFLTVVILLRKWKRRPRPSFSFTGQELRAGTDLLGIAIAHRLAAGRPRSRQRTGDILVLAEAAAIEPGLEIAPGSGIPGGTQGARRVRRATMVQMGNMATMLPARQRQPGGEQGSMESGHLAPLGRIGCLRKNSIGRLRVGMHGLVLSVWARTYVVKISSCH